MSPSAPSAPPAAVPPSLAGRIDAALPQTQCTRCGHPDCRHYAEAIARGEAGIDRCPPGGAEGIARLAAITGRSAQAIDPECGSEGPRALAVIDEAWCIGCTLCIKACPVDAIVGASKLMHTVIDEHCTGCELCVPACPVDCISMHPVSGTRTGWAAWSAEQAAASRARHARHLARVEREAREHDERLTARAPGSPRAADANRPAARSQDAAADRRAVIEAALARARAQARIAAKAARPDEA